MDALKIIEKQKNQQKLKRDSDVVELYLSDSNLNNVTSLQQFKNLQTLWLSGNKLRTINCVQHNYSISKLYLHNNELIDINGAFGHLHSLEIVMLHNNQLEKLEHIMKEFKFLQRLKTLNLFNNPVSQETGYRHYVIHHVPSVELLDRHEVTYQERCEAEKIYDQSRGMIRDSIAFGRRSQGPPDVCYPAPAEPTLPTVPEQCDVGNNFYRDNPPYATEEQAIKVRAMRRSLMEHTYLDWSKVKSSLERRLEGEDATKDLPPIVTTRFR